MMNFLLIDPDLQQGNYPHPAKRNQIQIIEIRNMQNRIKCKVVELTRAKYFALLVRINIFGTMGKDANCCAKPESKQMSSDAGFKG